MNWLRKGPIADFKRKFSIKHWTVNSEHTYRCTMTALRTPHFLIVWLCLHTLQQYACTHFSNQVIVISFILCIAYTKCVFTLTKCVFVCLNFKRNKTTTTTTTVDISIVEKLILGFIMQNTGEFIQAVIYILMPRSHRRNQTMKPLIKMKIHTCTLARALVVPNSRLHFPYAQLKPT